MWKVSYTRSAARAIRKLDPQVQKRIRAAVEILRTDPLRGKPLQLTLQGLRSWRTGDWRIVYRVIENRLEILVVAVGHRREVYDRLHDLLR
ncbi:MAG: type II toxin-antitoxin system RelE/ParE family toxin [Acidobacteria bacterium]|nr:type II toxin-antitoxin system RelE/ParE family toxin [Acidobacteriota bacterium]